MGKNFTKRCLLIAACICISSATVCGGADVDLTSLLLEMTDRDQLARWPQANYQQRQASSYDRAQSTPQNAETWFANKDHGQFMRTETRGDRREWVIMQDDGPGCVTHIWIPLHPKKWDQVVRFYLDGAEQPALEAKWNELVSGKAFIKPPLAFVAAGKDDAPDAGDMYLPIPYAQSCKITLDSEPFYYIINYRTYDADTTVESFTMKRFDATDDVRERVGKQLVESGNVAAGKTLEAEATIKPQGELALDLPAGPSAVRTITLKVPPDTKPQALRSTVIAMHCDEAQTIWCPIGDFFGSGARLRAVEDFHRTVAADGTLTCRWVMPYASAARLTVMNLGAKPLPAKLSAVVGEWTWDDASLQFHATWRAESPIQTQPRSDWNYVQIRGRGVYVGDTLSVLSHAAKWYGEGDERIYVDGEKIPSHLGTGTEDYYGYAWGMTTQFSSPFLAMPRRDRAGGGDWRGYTTTSRVRALDAIPFGQSLQVDMEIWHWADTQVAYAVGEFWYARPGATSNRPPDPKQAAAALPELPEPFAIPGAIEGEILKVAARSPDTPAERQPLDAYGAERFSGGAQLFVRGKKKGDFVELLIPVGDDRPRRLSVHMLKSWDYGIVRFTAGGKSLGKDLDMYSPTVEPTGPLALGVIEPTDQAIRLRIEVVGTNPEAKPPGAYFGLDCIVLEQP